MFIKASLLAALLPLATAITLNVPNGTIQAGSSVTISWTSESGDPSVFSLELVNAPILINAIAIANNVQTSAGSITLTLPIVAADSAYTIEAVNIGNINDVFSTTSPFAVEAASTSASLSVASSSSVAAASSSASGSSATSATISSAASAASSAASSASAAATGRTSSFVTAASSLASAASSAASAATASTSASSFNAAAGLSAPAGMVAAGAMGAVALVAGLMF